MPRELAHSWTTLADGTRRRVHSPDVATRTTVVPVTVVGGSTNASTPCRVLANSSRCLRSSDTALRETVEPPRPLRRNRPNRPPERATGPPADATGALTVPGLRLRSGQ